MESFVAIYREPLEDYTQNLAARSPFAHAPYEWSIQTFVPGALCICDANFDVAALKKSILKKTDCEVLLGNNRAGWNMAEGRLIKLLHAAENRSLLHRAISSARMTVQESAICNKPFFV